MRLYSDLALQYLRWPPSARPRARILCVHGWVYNCATFANLAPQLASQLSADVVALDLAGHGRSDHRTTSSNYSILAYAHDLVLALDALEASLWTGEAVPIVLVGHSMGGGLCSVLAGSYPDRFSALVLIDNIGLSARPAADAPAIFRNAVASLRAGGASLSAGAPAAGPPTPYASVEDAVQQRLKTVTLHPGAQSLSHAAAELLVRRALVEVPAASSGADTQYRFGHDRRIVGPSLLFAVEDHARAFLAAVRCPTLVVRAINGWPLADDVREARIAALARLSYVSLPGSHHLHLDPDTAPAVCRTVVEFVGNNLVNTAK